MLLLLDRAEITKASAREWRPLCANDLLPAMAAEMWAIEHAQRFIRIGSRPEIKKGRLSIVQLIEVVKPRIETATGATALQ